MNCFLYHHLQQKIYLAGIRMETKEAERLSNELSKHVEKCAECNGFAAQSLEDNLFGQTVTIRSKHDNHSIPQ